MNIIETVQLFIVFFAAVILHEYAHGWVAYRLGDSTAKLSGRLTLNPIKHIDPVGTILLPLTLRLINSPVVFGWAKPVPVNFMNLRHPKRDMIWVGLAGPAINVFMAVFFSCFLKFPLSVGQYRFFETAIIINLILAVFNLMPIPPLDGSRLVMGLLPYRYAYPYSRMERYGILVVFLLLWAGLVERFVFPVVLFLAYFLGVR